MRTYETKATRISENASTNLRKQFELLGFRITDLASLLRSKDGVLWTMTCFGPDGDEMVIESKEGMTKCVRQGVVVTHSHDKTWAVELRNDKKTSQPTVHTPDPDGFVIAWEREPARERAKHAANFLRTWGYITPEVHELATSLIAQSGVTQ